MQNFVTQPLHFVNLYENKVLHNIFQVILSKSEGIMLIFPIENEIKIRENCHHAFFFGWNDLRFFV